MTYEQSTSPGELFNTPVYDRRTKPVRMKYSPEITLGNVATIVALMGTLLGSYGIYVKDNERQDNKIAAIEKGHTEDKIAVKETLTKLEAGMEKMQSSLTTLDKNVAILNAKTGNSK